MSQVELIAEIAQAHDGSLGLLHSYIDALAETGVQTAKFQMHIAHAESSEFEQFRVPFSFEDKTRYDYWKRMEFTFEQWTEIKKHCEDKGLRFLCSPFSVEAFSDLEKLKVDRHKIASGETTNFLLLDLMAKSGKPLLLSSGMSSFDELDKTIERIDSNKGNIEALFQCTTAYPTPAEKLGLNVISEMRNKYYKFQIGLSDHSGEIYPGLAAVSLGATKLEFHVVFDKKMFGPDATSSLTLQQTKQLAEGVKFISTSLQHPVNKNDNESFGRLKELFGKSLALKVNAKKDDVLTTEMLESKKPGGKGISPSEYQNTIGKKLNKDIPAGGFLNNTDLQ